MFNRKPLGCQNIELGNKDALSINNKYFNVTQYYF